MKDLKSELGGNLEEVTLAMMERCELFDAKSLRHAMKVRKLVCVCVYVCISSRHTFVITRFDFCACDCITGISKF